MLSPMSLKEHSQNVAFLAPQTLCKDIRCNPKQSCPCQSSVYPSGYLRRWTVYSSLRNTNGTTDPSQNQDLERRFIRYRARVLYDGTHFSGWQFQSKQRTVQGEIDKAISRRLRYPIRVTGAGRTDSGVHAKGQTMHFDVPEELAIASTRWNDDPSKFEFSINRMLSDDVKICQVEEAKAEFEGAKPWHAIASAKGKLYSYRIFVGPWMDPLDRLYRHCVYQPCDISKVAEALQRFEGKHDFASFANSAAGVNYDEKCTERTISRAELVDEKDGRYRLDFVIDGALYRMIRNITGFVLLIGCGKLGLEDIEATIQCRNRGKAPKSAPAHGLCLEKVFYDQPSNPGSSFVMKRPRNVTSSTQTVALE